MRWMYELSLILVISVFVNDVTPSTTNSSTLSGVASTSSSTAMSTVTSMSSSTDGSSTIYTMSSTVSPKSPDTASPSNGSLGSSSSSVISESTVVVSTTSGSLIENTTSTNHRTSLSTTNNSSVETSTNDPTTNQSTVSPITNTSTEVPDKTTITSDTTTNTRTQESTSTDPITDLATNTPTTTTTNSPTTLTANTSTTPTSNTSTTATTTDTPTTTKTNTPTSPTTNTPTTTTYTTTAPTTNTPTTTQLPTSTTTNTPTTTTDTTTVPATNTPTTTVTTTATPTNIPSTSTTNTPSITTTNTPTTSTTNTPSTTTTNTPSITTTTNTPSTTTTNTPSTTTTTTNTPTTTTNTPSTTTTNTPSTTTTTTNTPTTNTPSTTTTTTNTPSTTTTTTTNTPSSTTTTTTTNTPSTTTTNTPSTITTTNTPSTTTTNTPSTTTTNTPSTTTTNTPSTWPTNTPSTTATTTTNTPTTSTTAQEPTTTTTDDPTTHALTTYAPITNQTTQELTTTTTNVMTESAYETTMPTPTTNSTTEASSTTVNNTTESTTVITTELYQCGDLENPDHGSVNTSDGNDVGAVAIYSCNIGYILNGSDYNQCVFNGSGGEWINTTPTCDIIDCGRWNASTNDNYYVTYDSTTYGSTAISICYPGYKTSDNKTSVAASCLANGSWDPSTPPSCSNRIVCTDLNVTNTLVNVTYTNYYKYVNSKATFVCPDSYSIIGYKLITCLPSGRWSGDLPTCEKVTAQACKKNEDSLGGKWNETKPGEIAVLSCKSGYIGIVSRQCTKGGRWLLPVYDCVSQAIAEVDSTIEAIKSSNNVSEADVVNALDKLDDITKPSDATTVYGGEIEKVTSILDTIVDITEKVNVTTKQTQSFVNIASNLLSTKNTESWKSISQNQGTEDNKTKTGATKILDVVSKYSEAVIKSLNSETKNTTINTENLVLHASKIDENSEVKFPPDETNVNVSCSFMVPETSLQGVNNYSAIVYRNISSMMSTKLSSDSDEETTHAINSAVISVKMAGYDDNFSINITLGHLDENSYVKPKCSFWNDTLNAWSEEGCKPVVKADNQTICQCDHLTNFAILMSPWTQDNVDTDAIDVISIIGCCVSVLGLLITVIMHISLWKYLKSDRVVLLMHLSIALMISYGIFIGGVDRTENEDTCTVIAVLLHYIYLVVFFLMLAEGIEIAVTLLYVFSTKSRLKWMIPCAWFLPAVVVGISIGATQLEGYGNELTCWLTVDQGLIWAFVAPALVVIMINFVLLVLVMKAMFRASSLAQKSSAERVRSGVRCLCILVPLMGCSWVIGIFYVNESVAWIQYVFAVCNSLQGLVIFLFHCILNKQIRVAIQKKRKLYYTSSLTSKQTSSTFSLPRVSLSNNSLYSDDNYELAYPASYDRIPSRRVKQ